jgi:hypothetical protein
MQFVDATHQSQIVGPWDGLGAVNPRARQILRIPTQSGRPFRREAGHHSDLISDAIPI